MKRLSEIEINGIKYPLNFSIKAGRLIAEKYGSLEGALKDLDTDKTDVETFDKMIFIVETMMEQGQEYMKLSGKESPTPLSKDEMEVFLDFNDTGYLMSCVVSGTVAGSEQEVETEDPNEKTTQAK